MGVVMAPMAPDYGQRIRRRRQVLGLSQKELAERVGVSESAVISWEKYRHAPTRRQGAVEAVLGISLDGEPEHLDPDEQEFAELLARLRDNPLTKELDLRSLEQAFEQRKQRGRHRAPRGASELAS